MADKEIDIDTTTWGQPDTDQKKLGRHVRMPDVRDALLHSLASNMIAIEVVSLFVKRRNAGPPLLLLSPRGASIRTQFEIRYLFICYLVTV